MKYLLKANSDILKNILYSSELYRWTFLATTYCFCAVFCFSLLICDEVKCFTTILSNDRQEDGRCFLNIPLFGNSLCRNELINLYLMDGLKVC